jgi:hypothetical protein
MSVTPAGRFRQPHDVFQVSQDDHPRLAGHLLSRLQKQRAEMIENIAKNLAQDFPEYKRLCGVIEGLDIAISLAEEAKRIAEA